MIQKSYPNPLYKEWSLAEQVSYLRTVKERGLKRREFLYSDYCYFSYNETPATYFHRHYKEGRALGLLHIDFAEFCNYVKHGLPYRYRSPENPHSYVRGWHWRSEGFYKNSVPFRHKKKYQKQPHHNKKEDLILNPKEAYRIETGHYKDKAKCTRHRTAPKWMKRQSNHEIRSRVKTLINNQDWDALSDDFETCYKDPWMWD